MTSLFYQTCLIHNTSSLWSSWWLLSELLTSISVDEHVSWCSGTNLGWSYFQSSLKDNIHIWSWNSSTCAATCVSCSLLSLTPLFINLQDETQKTVGPVRSTHRCRWWYGWWNHPLRTAWWGRGALQRTQALSAPSGCASWAPLCWLLHPLGSHVPTSAATPSGWRGEPRDIWIISNVISHSGIGILYTTALKKCQPESLDLVLCSSF